MWHLYSYNRVTLVAVIRREGAKMDCGIAQDLMWVLYQGMQNRVKR